MVIWNVVAEFEIKISSLEFSTVVVNYVNLVKDDPNHRALI